MTAAEVLREAAVRGIVLRAEDGRVKGQAPAGALAGELRAAIRERKTELLAILVPPGLPLLPPDYEVPPEWQPAPEWTPDEQAVHDATLGEMAEVLPDAELVRFVTGYGGELYVDEKGALRAKGAAAVPAPVRAEVRSRQAALVALLAGEDVRAVTTAPMGREET